MPDIIGKTHSVNSSLPPLDSHLSHIGSLAHSRIAREVLIDFHNLPEAHVRKYVQKFCSHISQALEFHYESKKASIKIRPVLQYYSFLNIAVAAIIAFKPHNFEQFGRHGVSDNTYSLASLKLSSKMVSVGRGAVPLFHSIYSDAPIAKKDFSLGQLLSGFHMVHHEIGKYFGKSSLTYFVNDSLVGAHDKWHSRFCFSNAVGQSSQVSARKIEEAMPLIKSAYEIVSKTKDELIYNSKKIYSSMTLAEKDHRANGIKIINFGGHSFKSINGEQPNCVYAWNSLSSYHFLPCLTSILLLSFSIASIARYRPILLESTINSPINVLFGTFVSEADAIFFSSVRNLLYREQLSVSVLPYF